MPIIARLAAIPVVAAVVALGVWAAGGLVTDEFRASLLLTGLWLVAAGAACILLVRRVRALRWPVLGAYVAAVATIGVWLGSTTLRDRVVDENVVTGVAPSDRADASSGDRAGTSSRDRAGTSSGDRAGASSRDRAGASSGDRATGSSDAGTAASGATAADDEAARDAPPPARVNVELAAGAFRSGEHETRGRATVVRLASGRRVLTLTGFETSPGPDLRVRLVPGDTLDGGASGHVDLGGLKGNRGDQQYALPTDAPVRGHSVVVWCRAFSASFGSALLRASPSMPN